MTEQDKITDAMAAREADVWAKMLDTEAGRWVAHSILDMCGVFRQSFVAGGPDATAFAEGCRSIGLRILQDRVMANGAEVFASMMRENDARIDRIRFAIEQDQKQQENNDV